MKAPAPEQQQTHSQHHALRYPPTHGYARYRYRISPWTPPQDKISSLKVMTHIVLLLLVAREDTDFLDIACQKATKHSVTERSGTTGDQKGFVFKY